MWNRKKMEELLQRKFNDFQKEVIEDAVSYAIEVLFNSKEKIINKEAWIYKVAYRKLLKDYKHMQIENKYLKEKDTYLDLGHIDMNYCWFHFLNQEIDEILTSNEKKVIIMCYEGFSFEEIGKKLNKKKNNIKQLKYRAKKKLEKYL